MKDQRNFLQSFLVAISLLLLLGFLIYWNIDQFNTEKGELVEKLETQMSLACSEYRDSVVNDVFRLIKISDGHLNKESFKLSGKLSKDKPKLDSIFQEEILFDSINQRVVFVESEKDKQVGKEYPNQSKFELKEQDGVVVWENTALDSIFTQINVYGPELDRYPGLHDPEHRFGDTIINFVLDESRFQKDLVIWRSDSDSIDNIELARDLNVDTTIIWGFPDGTRYSNLNSKGEFPMPTLFNKIDTIFKRRLNEENLAIPYRRLKTLDPDLNVKDNIAVKFEYELKGYSDPPVALFYNYRSYLFQKLTPSLLMSLVLFGVVAISFFFISKTWKAQLRLTKLKNEFISNMTHELNTPIATIGVAIEALENYGAMDDPIRRKEYIDISKQEVSRLKYLVDKVLNLSTLENGYSELNKVEEDLKDLVEKSVGELALHLENSKAEVNFEFKGSDFRTNIDREHFTNVIHNLLDNAIKYSIEAPRIEIIMKSKERDIAIQFSDNGIGIPKDYQKKIFDRFFRVPNADRHNTKGHGLGLHYVKSILEKHGGTIELKKSNGGTSFLISIPKQ